MIVTKNWLQEWVDIADITTEKICEKLNSIGLEVDSTEALRIPEKVVVGRVLACEKHPDADKLNICQVDLGFETTQIVCGAKNVAAGQTVPVATIGADLGNGFVIKKAKLRGVESNGMICGADEIGLPKMNDGILVLDESIGELVLGKELRSYEALNDDIIDIELTANRGDCLSIRGVARDLAAAFGRDLRRYERSWREDRRGIARVLAFDVVGKAHVDVVYRFMELEPCRQTLLEAFRIACAQKYTPSPWEQKRIYAIHSTGVILRAYDFDKLYNVEGKVELTLKRDAEGIESLYYGDKRLSQIGLNQEGEFAKIEGRHAIVEASYIDPDRVATYRMEHACETDDLYYNTSRGSETDLALGLDFFCDRAQEACGAKIYSGEHRHAEPQEKRVLQLTEAYIENFIGQSVDMSDVVSILERLGIATQSEGDFIRVTVPPYRTDIAHKQDIIEEIVRFIGIDNIAARPLEIVEKRRINESYTRYKKRTLYRTKAAGAGFFEAVHYFFDNRKVLESYGLPVVDEALDLANPISEELNTLRTTLLMHLIESAGENLKNGRKRVQLFELGRVVDSSREEHEKIAFLFSGQREDASLQNSGKPEPVDFFSFCDTVSAVVGAFTLQKDTQTSALFSPYEQARVMIAGEDAGVVARLHANVEKAYDLPRTYVCELDFDKLYYGTITAKPFARFPSLQRDLSLLVPDSVTFDAIKSTLESEISEAVRTFYPIDLYEDESLGERRSLTVRFEIRSDEKTLTEEEISEIMDGILTRLQETLGITLR